MMGLRALIGALVPLRFSAALLLRAELRKHRPGQPDLPPAAIDAFVAVAIGGCELQGFKGALLKAEVVSWVERDAMTISDLLSGRLDPARHWDTHWVKILRKHGALPSSHGM